MTAFDLNAMAELLQSVDTYLRAGVRAPATRKTYLQCWAPFERWCRERGLAALPVLESTLLLYLADLARRSKTSTVRVHAFSIAYVHTAAGFASPLTDRVFQLMTGVARLLGERAEPKQAITADQLRRMVEACGADPLGRRNRAVLLVGFASGLRRSDLAALELCDARFVPLPDTEYVLERLSHREGLVLHVGRSRREKNDQAGRGRQVPVFPGEHEATCPVRALRVWLEVRGDAPGALLCHVARGVRPGYRALTPRGIADIVKVAAGSIGLDPKRYGGHSLRSGLVSAATAGGASDSAIMRQTGHRSQAMLNRYVRNLFGSNPLAGVL
jgi:integrase